MDEEMIQSEENPEQQLEEETAAEDILDVAEENNKEEEAVEEAEEVKEPEIQEKESSGTTEKRNMRTALLIMLAVLTIVLSVAGSYLVTTLVIRKSEKRVVVYEGVQTTAVNLTTADLSPVVEKIQDTVVEVYTEKVVYSRYYGEYITAGAGSGVIYSSDGYIITNNHVIDGASNITVKTADGEVYEALLIAADEDTDLAVIKIEATGLHSAVLGTSSNLKTGQGVIAIGNPMGTLGGTVTTGIVSSLSRTITIEGAKMTLLQTDTAISPGNSGGGLFNMAGELIAVVNAKSVSENVEGIGFAIPVDIVKKVITDLITVGYVTGRPALGIGGQEVNNIQIAKMNGYNHVGIYVGEIISENAKNSGLQEKDLIFEVNGEPVDSFASMRYELYKYNIGDEVTLKVERNGQEMEIKVILSAKSNS